MVRTVADCSGLVLYWFRTGVGRWFPPAPPLWWSHHTMKGGSRRHTTYANTIPPCGSGRRTCATLAERRERATSTSHFHDVEHNVAKGRFGRRRDTATPAEGFFTVAIPRRRRRHNTRSTPPYHDVDVAIVRRWL